MKITLFLLFCIAIGVIFFALGRLIGDRIGKKQKMQDEVLRNGSKHV